MILRVFSEGISARARYTSTVISAAAVIRQKRIMAIVKQRQQSTEKAALTHAHGGVRKRKTNQVPLISVTEVEKGKEDAGPTDGEWQKGE